MAHNLYFGHQSFGFGPAVAFLAAENQGPGRIWTASGIDFHGGGVLRLLGSTTV